mgnify:CR=1 FL=1
MKIIHLSSRYQIHYYLEYHNNPIPSKKIKLVDNDKESEWYLLDDESHIGGPIFLGEEFLKILTLSLNYEENHPEVLAYRTQILIILLNLYPTLDTCFYAKIKETSGLDIFQLGLTPWEESDYNQYFTRCLKLNQIYPYQDVLFYIKKYIYNDKFKLEGWIWYRHRELGWLISDSRIQEEGYQNIRAHHNLNINDFKILKDFFDYLGSNDPDFGI